ncbi:MAG: hypothetical protein AAGJ46_19795 [Planctomycetota bacterium]
MGNEARYDHVETDYSYGDDGAFREGARPNSEKRKKPTQGRKRGKVPSSFNGMHRRRRRKMAW